MIINGSPRVNGNTAIAANEMAKVFHIEGVETDIVQVVNKDVRGCIACGQCAGQGTVWLAGDQEACMDAFHKVA